MKKVIVLFVVFLLTMVGSVQAGLNDPAVANPSFEDVVTSGWEWYAGAPWAELNGVWLESKAGSFWQRPDETPYGENVIRIGYGASLFQEIGTWSPDTPYEVTVWIAERYDVDVDGNVTGTIPSGFVVELWGGGATGYATAAAAVPEEADLWNNTGATWIDYQGFTIADTGSTSGDVTAMFNTSDFNTGGLVEGDPLWVRIAAYADADLSIDNVRVVVPEPATMTLLGLGGMALLRRRRKS